MYSQFHYGLNYLATETCHNFLRTDGVLYKLFGTWFILCFFVTSATYDFVDTPLSFFMLNWNHIYRSKNLGEDIWSKWFLPLLDIV